MRPAVGALLVISGFAFASALATPAEAATGGGGGGPFNQDAFKAAIAIHESGNNYGSVNSIGYIGKYQFGAAALTDLGYIKLSVYQQYPANNKNACLRDPNAWIAPYTREGWLADHAEQEKAMDALIKAHRRSLTADGIITSRSTAAEQGAWLAVAHGLGAGAANTYFRRGETKPDGYGTTAAQIYRIGAYSQRHPYQVTMENRNDIRDGRIV